MKTKLVAEIGINHNGDIELAKKLIDAAVLGGCSYVKFQKRTIDAVYTKEELDKYRESPFGLTNREQKEGLEFNKEEYDVIDQYCKEKGIKWFGSPWDVKSVDFLMKYNPEYIKLASASLSDTTIINKINEYNVKVIVATGMGTKDELDKCLDILGSKISWILSCTSTYPTLASDMNMNKIKTLQKMYGDYNIGFSNHSAGTLFITMAAILGCGMIEYHITLDRAMYGSDQAASIEVPGLMKIKDYIESIEKSWGSGEIQCLDNEKPIKDKLRTSK